MALSAGVSMRRSIARRALAGKGLVRRTTIVLNITFDRVAHIPPFHFDTRVPILTKYVAAELLKLLLGQPRITAPPSHGRTRRAQWLPVWFKTAEIFVHKEVIFQIIVSGPIHWLGLFCVRFTIIHVDILQYVCIRIDFSSQ